MARSGSPGTRDAWVEIDLDALRHNLGVLRTALPAATRLGLVVKADGYGHGLDACGRLAADGGADALMVATLDEGVALRHAGVELPVLVLYAIPAAAVAAAASARLTLSVSSPGHAAALARAVESLPGEVADRPLEVHLEVDTGMTRDGVMPEEVVGVARLLAASRRLRQTGTWSHLAIPEEPAAVDVQARRFEDCLAELADAGIDPGLRHLCASGGLLCASAPVYDLVRVGLAWYGVVAPEWLGPRPDVTGGLRPALSVHARAVRLAEVPRGARVGYGGAWTATRPSRIATLPLGYGDGVLRSSWPGGEVLVRGRRAPIVGRVSMDALTVDVTDAGPLGGDELYTLIGEQDGTSIGAVEVAGRRGTIAWEVLVTLAARLPRLYRPAR